MAITIHPYKGYLNTPFHVFYKGNQEIEYKIFSHQGEFIKDGALMPNEPHSFLLNLSGNFIVKFSDGTITSIYVEDSYRYGGSKHKKSYIFDNCPWLFIVMHDRTYFFNRETKEAYVETMSPDKISLIGTNHILLKNNGQDDQTVYSLEKQRPILDVSHVAFFNNDCIIWEEKDDTSSILLLYSFITKEIIRQNIDFFEIDIDSQRVLYVWDNIVKSISFNDFNRHMLLDSVQGKMVAIVKPYLAISYEEKSYGNYMYLYNFDTKLQLKKVLIDGHLAKIGNTTFINVYQRRKCIDNVDFESNEILDINISANYLSFDFYPTSWDVFYIQKHTKITRNKYRTDFEENISLHSINGDFIKELNREFTNHFIDDNVICLYNSNESWVSSVSGRCDYVLGGRIYIYNKRVFLEKDSSFYRLRKNGYWNEYLKKKYSTKYLDEFGFIVNEEDNKCQTLGGFQLGILRKPMGIYYKPEAYTKTDRYFIFSNGRNIRTNDIKRPTALSESLMLGINIENEGVFLCKLENGRYTHERILEDIFDPSKYKDVLLSEDGKSIMYRKDEQTTILDLENGQQISYDNLSYIKQINGIRPQFKRCAATLQPRIINPITKLPIDCDTLTDFHFVSPDGKYYADTRLEDYIEYFYRSNNKLISKEEYLKMVRLYQYPWQDKKDSSEWLRIRNLRKSFLLANYGFLVKEYSDILKSHGEEWGKEILDNDVYKDVVKFISLIVGKRGIAVIRNTNDSSVFTKIDLGEPLSYINYVSFSFDSKYLAIAGHRYESHLNQGLLLIYDLTKKEIVLSKNTNRAVWFVAFSESSALGAYTSDPFTFFAQNETDFTMDFDEAKIKQRNFLTFSPDGKYFALSEQGYVSKYDRYGNINYNWGHQPSSLVEIHVTSNPKVIIKTFTDLSDTGIDGVAVKAGCVASVSFSNENKRIMMVGKDGVVIVRNLHLEDYAGK